MVHSVGSGTQALGSRGGGAGLVEERWKEWKEGGSEE